MESANSLRDTERTKDGRGVGRLGESSIYFEIP